MELPNYRPTTSYSWAGFRPRVAAYISAHTEEERTHLPPHWQGWAAASGVQLIALAESSSSDSESVVVTGLPGASHLYVNLRSRQQLDDFFAALPEGEIILDITGMRYSTWAGILLHAWNRRTSISVAYSEPVRYAGAVHPSPGKLFELSLGSVGIGPLPGFASLRSDLDPNDTQTIVILGFEGARTDFVLNSLEPGMEKVQAIVGLPGFKPEYPFFSMLANRSSLEREYLHSRTSFAKASCPFDLFFTLERLQRKSGERVRLVPLGTKPHALGCVLYYINQLGRVDIVYDHPKPKSDGGTQGRGVVHVYRVSEFLRVFEDSGGPDVGD